MVTHGRGAPVSADGACLVGGMFSACFWLIIGLCTTGCGLIHVETRSTFGTRTQPPPRSPQNVRQERAAALAARNDQLRSQRRAQPARAQTEPPAVQPVASPRSPDTTPSPPVASAPRLEDQAWVHDLPGVERVRKTITGDSQNDSVARQDAAFEILRNYITARAGFNPDFVAAPPGVANQLSDYLAAQTKRKLGTATLAGLTDAADAYFAQGPEFHLATLSALLSPESVAAYKSTPQFQKLSAELVAKREGMKAVNAILAEKKLAKVDVSMFGIPLYEPLRLPACAEDPGLWMFSEMVGVGRGGENTCTGDPAGSMSAAIAVFVTAMLTGRTQESKYTWTAVRLADAMCPTWMKTGGSCLAMVATQYGFTIGILAPTGATGSELKSVVEQLGQKFGTRAAAKDIRMQCWDRRTGLATLDSQEFVWQPNGPSGLRVTYDPVGGDCVHGNLLFASAVMRSVLANPH
jgi:hypothetical protein